MDPRVLSQLDEMRGVVTRSDVIEQAVIIELLRRKLVQDEYDRYNHASRKEEAQDPR